jgi:glutamate dehydrogenase (NAD(P)+)
MTLPPGGAELSLRQVDGQSVYTARGPEGVLGYLVIDSTVGDRACGGLRLLPDVDEAEMRGLAAAMTLKYGFLGLPQGGAKAGVRGDPEGPADQRRRTLEAFGHAIAPLLRSRAFNPGPDMGTDNGDIRHLLACAGVPVGRRELRGERSGHYTALSVFAAAREALGLLGEDLRGKTVAIEGFGKVGGALARLMVDHGARVVAVSNARGAVYAPDGLDVGGLHEAVLGGGGLGPGCVPGARGIHPERLLELGVDVLCPCARHDRITAENVGSVRARVVSSGANNPLTRAAELSLHQRGIVCVPDFVSNCGGVLGGTMTFAGWPEASVKRALLGPLAGRIGRVLAEARRRAVAPVEVAETWSRRRFAEVQAEVAAPGPRGRLFALGLAAYRRGWLPAPLVARLSVPYFRGRLD